MPAGRRKLLLYESPNSRARGTVQKNTTLKGDDDMAESIGPLSQPLPPEQKGGAVPNVPLLSKQMQEQVLSLADQLQKVLEDPTLATQKTFLDEFAHHGTHLNQIVDQAILLR